MSASYTPGVSRCHTTVYMVVIDRIRLGISNPLVELCMHELHDHDFDPTECYVKFYEVYMMKVKRVDRLCEDFNIDSIGKDRQDEKITSPRAGRGVTRIMFTNL